MQFSPVIPLDSPGRPPLPQITDAKILVFAKSVPLEPETNDTPLPKTPGWPISVHIEDAPLI